MVTGHDNAAYDGPVTPTKKPAAEFSYSTEKNVDVEKSESNARPNWSNKTEFLMSCIATSVGLGNIWRFPFTCYENGGGAFLIPYVFVLIIIGRPMYYLEMVVGQFTSRSSIKVWDLCPAFRGLSIGQICGTVCVITYYASLIALTLFYFFASFSTDLPWSRCLKSWGADCVDSLSMHENVTNALGNRSMDAGHGQAVSSSELYFLNTVLEEHHIEQGIGYPKFDLALCLLLAWITIFCVISRGVKSSGKAAYFLALFPYVVICVLLVRAVTLDGAMNGIIFFLKPQWGELLNPKVWKEAIVQLFFSLGFGFSFIIMFSSYNHFDHNVYRDAMIVTTLDTFTSLIAGITIFGILGNLAHNLGVEDISTVVKSGTGLAFISYPDAIAKLQFAPQVFAILFFFMLFVLGIGSVAALQSAVCTVLCDQFTSLKFWKVASVTSIIGFCSGLVYLTPAGQWILTLVDHYGGTLLIFVLGIFEVMGIFWIYGLENFCLDVEFMTGRHVTFYWRFCWAILSPIFMFTVFLYSLFTMKPLQYGARDYPIEYIVFGWSLFGIGFTLFPLWILWKLTFDAKGSMIDRFAQAFRPNKLWGPKNGTVRTEWLKFREEARQRKEQIIREQNHSWWKQQFYILLGKY